MIIDDLKEYYRNLLIIQYRTKPKAEGTINAVTEAALEGELPIKVRDAFNVDTAVGVQLDVLAKFFGVQRRNRTFTEIIDLSDADLRSLIKIAIIRNSTNSSLASVQQLLNDFFPSEILVFDFQNMRIGYFFDEAIGTRNLAEIFVRSGLIPKPMGVQLSTTIYSNNINSFFGFTDYEVTVVNNSPFNEYDDYQLDWPWLDYADGLVF